MAASKNSSRRHEHEWTGFERHTLLCLMAKNMHIVGAEIKDQEHHEGSTNCKSERFLDGSMIRKSQAYLDVATALNFALHGTQYNEDIPVEKVYAMIDLLLDEKKGVLGPGGTMDRLGGGRVTRTRKLTWERTDKRGFLGTVEEWEAGRRYVAMNEYRKERGLPLLPVEERRVELVIPLKLRAPPRRRSAPPGVRVASAPDGAQDLSGGQLTSFKRLPAALQADPRFQWVNLGKVKTAPSFKEVVRPNQFTQRNHRYKSERVGRSTRTPPRRQHVSALHLSSERISESLSDWEGAMQLSPEEVGPQTAARERYMKENVIASVTNAGISLAMGVDGKLGLQKTFGTELTNRSKRNLVDGETA